MAFSLELRTRPTLTIRAAIIEAYNIPNTAGEIADGIDRNVSSVRKVIRKLVQEGAMVRLGDRYMLIEGEGAGVRLLT